MFFIWVRTSYWLDVSILSSYMFLTVKFDVDFYFFGFNTGDFISLLALLI